MPTTDRTAASRAHDETDRFAGCLLGLAAGDAVGTAVEFAPRGTFEPVTGMTGGGPFRLPAGAWTDDTSLALCLGESLLACGGFDPADQIRRYLRWRREGHLSSTGKCFDIGRTTAAALDKFARTGEPFSGSTAADAAGNGSIMRLAPVALRYYPDLARTIAHCGVSSRTTHAAAACVDACRLLGAVLYLALAGHGKEAVLAAGRAIAVAEVVFTDPGIVAISRGEYLGKDRDEIRGSGYVVESLEAALWCFARSGSFAEAVLMATNLGQDADTTAAVCGQIAGAYYGKSGIPPAWLEKLVMRGEIERMALELREAGA